MEKKRGGFLRGVFDGLRSSVGSQSGQGSQGSTERSNATQDIEENLTRDNFQVFNICLHGFPYSPTALAFDPIQKLIAIGTQSGSMRILGRPGVDIHFKHTPGYPVIQIIFLVNEGSLITVCADDSLHLWNLKQKEPVRLQSLKFQKERITYCHLTHQTKWIYIGTERGNVYTANIDSFTLSNYVINWNKVIEVSRKTHPGGVIHLSDCPTDPNKLLIGYDSGTIVIWDLRGKAADLRISYHEALKSVCWHHEGRQFICSHSNGSITTWGLKSSKPSSLVFPHAKNVGENLKPEPCKPIWKVEWRRVRNGDSYIIFSGGLPYRETGGEKSSSPSPTPSPATGKQNGSNNGSIGTQSLTVIHGKTTTVLEMEHNIIDFVTLCESPWESDFNDPYAIVVLLYNDLVVVDLTTQGYPCFQNPYTMDLHESPITYCSYLADCPSDLIPALYSVGHRTKRIGFSEKEWPINGGEWGTATLSYPELIITGHADGCLKFWDASSVNLHMLYKLKTSKIFNKPKNNSGKEDASIEDPFAIEQITFCPESRMLAVAGSYSQVILYRFNRQEAQTDLAAVEVPMKYDVSESEREQNISETTQGIKGLLRQQGNSEEGLNMGGFIPLTVKRGIHKRPPGFQPELVCLSPWINNSTPPYKITSLTLNSNCNLIAYGSENGLIMVDLIQKYTVFNVATAELYGTMDYQRHIKSPKRNLSNSTTKQVTNDGNQSDNDRCKSPVDGSFSRSQSSSTSSLDNINLESVQCLTFMESYSKSDSSNDFTLWVGTGLGSVIVIQVSLPETEDDRVLCLQSVLAVPTGNIFRLKGSILSVSFLDFSDGTRIEDKRGVQRTSTGPGNYSLSKCRVSSTSSYTDRDSQFSVVVSEKQVRVYSLPSQQSYSTTNLSETSFAVRADVVYMKLESSLCLAAYLGTGNIVVYSLPSLKPLADIDFLPLVDVRIARTISFSTNGHGMFLSSASEIQKFVISSAFRDTLPDMVGSLYVVKESPEPPKQGFFKGLFGVGPTVLDREELFGTDAGSSLKSTARHIPGSSNTEGVKAQSGTLAGELSKVRQALGERGENLEKLEDKTALMMNTSEGFRDASRALLMKYKDKKWYQF